jgi:predicted amidohydrolase
MTERLRLGIAQIPITCDPVANGAAVRRTMRAAAAESARLVHFPEGALSGYPGTPTAKRELAGWNIDWAAVGEQLRLTAELAADLRLWVVVGGSQPLAAPRRPHNSLFVFSDSGSLVGRYDKRICSFAETADWYTPGREPLVFDVDDFRFGCVLCIEVNFPELFLEYRARDVDCVLFSSFSEDPVFDVIARGHAAAHNSWISFSVPAHCSTAAPSGLIGPHGHRLASCAADGSDGLVCVDLDRADPPLDVALHRARPWRTAARLAHERRSLGAR